MPAVKTAISMDEQLFARVEKAAAEMEISRSQLFALAVEEFLKQRQRESLTRAINEALEGDVPTPEELEYERARNEFMKRRMWENTKDDEW